MNHAESNETRDTVSMAEAAKILGVPRSTLYGWVHSGEIQASGGRFARDEIERARRHPRRPRGRPPVLPSEDTVRIFGRAAPREMRAWTEHSGGDVWPWLRKLANARWRDRTTPNPMPRARTPANRWEKVYSIGRASEHEVQRWKLAANFHHGGCVWPWLREIANKAAGL